MELFTSPPPFGLKPNLAAKYVEEKQKFPCYGSPKIDGIRALGVAGQVLSRTLKPIPNRYVQSIFSNCYGLDGELVVGPYNHPNVMQATTSGVMRKSGEPDVTFYVFDRWDMPRHTFEERLASLQEGWGPTCAAPRIVVLEQVLLNNQEELDAFEAKCIGLGFEGIITRDPKRKYKNGRSTANEGGMTKVKRFSHGEGLIFAFEEMMHNDNEEFVNELGNVARSSHQENMVGTGMLGALWVSNPEFDKPFKISASTMTHSQKKWAWENRDKLKSEICRFSWFKHGIKDVPRHGQWAGFRHMMDLGVEHPLYNEKFANLPVTLEFPSE